MGSNWSEVNVFHVRLNSALDVTPIWTSVLNVKKVTILLKDFADLVQLSAKSVSVLISALFVTRINQH